MRFKAVETLFLIATDLKAIKSGFNRLLIKSIMAGLKWNDFIWHRIRKHAFLRQSLLATVLSNWRHLRDGNNMYDTDLYHSIVFEYFFCSFGWHSEMSLYIFLNSVKLIRMQFRQCGQYLESSRCIYKPLSIVCEDFSFLWRVKKLSKKKIWSLQKTCALPPNRIGYFLLIN